MKTETELINIIMSGKRESLCRVCLSDENNDPKISLFEELVDFKISLPEQISLCTRVRIIQIDQFPKMICNYCLKDLKLANDFRLKCENSEALLKKIFKVYSVKGESDLPAVNSGVYKEIPLKKLINLKDIKIEDFDYHQQEDSIIDYELSDSEAKMVKKKRKNIIKTDGSYAKKKKIQKQHNAKTNKKNSQLDLVCDITIKSESKDEKDLSGDFACPQCLKSFKSQYSLTLHTNRMHSTKVRVGYIVGKGAEKRFCCTDCEFQTKRRQTLEYHMSRHTGLKQFRCEECGRGFAQHSSLYTHMKIHSDKTYYICDYCTKEFKRRNTFIRHLLVHTDQRNYKCEICDKALKSKGALRDHINRHKQIKNYSCHICALRFVSLPELNNHMQCHNQSMKIYKCNVCTYSTYTKRMLVAHVTRHTASRDFACDQCDAAFQTIYSLNIHKRKHTKENKYPCPLCDTMFRYSYSVNKHMMRTHNKRFTWNSTIDRRVVK